jgi:hypothetical protein
MILQRSCVRIECVSDIVFPSLQQGLIYWVYHIYPDIWVLLNDSTYIVLIGTPLVLFLVFLQSRILFL